MAQPSQPQSLSGCLPSKTDLTLSRELKLEQTAPRGPVGSVGLPVLAADRFVLFQERYLIVGFQLLDIGMQTAPRWAPL